MKTSSNSSVVNLTILILAALFVAVVLLALSGANLPLLSNLKVDLALLLVLGLAICTQGGIGRIAATGQWSHPLAIVGYILGGLILVLSGVVFFNGQLPFFASQEQTFLVIAGLVGVKVVNAFAHYYLLGQRVDKKYA